MTWSKSQAISMMAVSVPPDLPAIPNYEEF
jgi:hypothetical protein